LLGFLSRLKSAGASTIAFIGEVAQWNNKTEHILSLLDGTLYQSVIDDTGIKAQQQLVVLMTCNTTERFDPAMLRKGRVELTYEFVHRFV